MTYASIDQLQKVIADEVFGYTKDKKKAAGRALGTLVEIVTFYMLRSWGFRDSVAIERPLAEFANPQITHNVEYSLHPVLALWKKRYERKSSLSASALRKLLVDELSALTIQKYMSHALLSKDGVLRNSCTVAETADGPIVAHADKLSLKEAAIAFSCLHRQPYAIFECKRVGVEEGMRKGPQTIEKAKQGAYVARTVSSLQKVRMRSGKMGGVIELQGGTLCCKPYASLVKQVIASNDLELLDGFILTVGVVSNHGNWFTSEDHNKELKVLAQSYDWLLFLTDRALSEFIDQLLLRPVKELTPARTAFLASYTGAKGKNRFTKVKMGIEADESLQRYFLENRGKLSTWFNVIAPTGQTLEKLHSMLDVLRKKNWRKIRGL